MKFIKTCYGEWINPALVKHFGIKSTDEDTKNFFAITADGITLHVIEYTLPTVDWGDETEEGKKLQKEWYSKRKALYQENRAKACAWLASLIAKLNAEEIKC